MIGFPESGTTWTEEIVWLLQNNLYFENSFNIKHLERVTYIDSGLSKGKINLLENMKTVFIISNIDKLIFSYKRNKQ